MMQNCCAIHAFVDLQFSREQYQTDLHTVQQQSGAAVPADVELQLQTWHVVVWVAFSEERKISTSADCDGMFLMGAAD